MNKILKRIVSLAFVGMLSLFIAVATTPALGIFAFILTLFISRYVSNYKFAMVACAGLVSGFEADCETNPVAGLEVEVWLMDRDKIDLSATTISGRSITAIAMLDGYYAYKFVGKKSSNASSITLAPQQYKNYWAHQWTGVIFDNTAATKLDIIEVLAEANVVAIVRNKWKGVSSANEFEVLGWDVGLNMSLGEKKSDDVNTQGAWKITMSSPKDEFESNVGYLIGGANQAAMLAIVEGLEQSGS